MTTRIDRASEDDGAPLARVAPPSVTSLAPVRSSAASRRPGVDASNEDSSVDRRKKSLYPMPKETDSFFRRLEPHLPALYKLIRFRVRDAADIEDVLQETLLHAFSNLDQLRSGYCLRAWLIQIAINEARKTLRAKQRTPFFCSIDQPSGVDERGHFVFHEIADWHETPVEALERTELAEMLQQKLATLRPKWRELLVLCDVQECNVAEAARQMGISLADARSSLYRARFALRELLAPIIGEASRQGSFWI
jgi:RNA polymerase sigma-70 factor, ECF subfamily